MAIQGFGFIGRGRVKREGRAVRPAIRLAIHAVRQELDRFFILEDEVPASWMKTWTILRFGRIYEDRFFSQLDCYQQRSFKFPWHYPSGVLDRVGRHL